MTVGEHDFDSGGEMLEIIAIHIGCGASGSHSLKETDGLST